MCGRCTLDCTQTVSCGEFGPEAVCGSLSPSCSANVCVSQCDSDVDCILFGMTCTNNQCKTPNENKAPVVALRQTTLDVQKLSEVTLDASPSFDPDGDPLRYNWFQLSGTAVDLRNSNTARPSFVAPQVSGTLTFSVTVADASSSSDAASVIVTITNQPPVADAGDDQEVLAGDVVQLSATRSFDPDGEGISYSWAQISGSPVEINVPTSDEVSFTAPSFNERLAFMLTISDGEASSTDTVVVNVSAETYEGQRAYLPSHPTRNILQYPAATTPTTLDILELDGHILTYHDQTISVVQQGSESALREETAFPLAELIAMSASENMFAGLTPQRLHLFARSALPEIVPQGTYLFDTDTPPGHVALSPTRAYVALGLEEIAILDITNPNAIELVANIPLSTPLTAQPARALQYTDGLLVTLSGDHLQTFDLSNPDAPVLLGDKALESTPRSLFVQGQQASFILEGAAGSNTILTIDLTDPVTLEELGRTQEIGHLLNFTKTGNTLCGLANNAFYLFNTSDPSNLQRIGIYPHFEQPINAVIQGEQLYLHSSTQLEVLSLTQQGSQTPLFELPQNFQDLAIAGDLIAAHTNTQLNLLQNKPEGIVSLLTLPEEINCGDSPNESCKIRMEGNQLYRTSPEQGLEIYDISRPENIALSHAYQLSGNLYDFEIDQNLLYLAVENHGLDIVDISMPSTPTLRGELHQPTIRAVEFAENIVFILTAGTLVLAELSPLQNLQVTGQWNALPELQQLAVDGNIAAVLNDNGNISLLDISRPTAPFLLHTFVIDFGPNSMWGYHGQLSEPGLPLTIALQGHTLRVAFESAGIWTFDISQPSTPILRSHTTLPGSLQTVTPGQTEASNTFAVGARNLGVYAVTPVDLAATYSVEERYITASSGQTLNYTLRGWTGERKVACAVSAGECFILEEDPEEKTVQLQWYLPAEPGDYELAIALTNFHEVHYIYRNQVSVQ